MSIKRIAGNESGITYTLEAIIGIVLIIGTIIYITGNLPYTAQKTGEFSKVQLMNIGRDNLDLTLITPIYETCPSCMDVQVPRLYLLCIGESSPSDCVKDGFVKPNETIIFKVYYANGTPVPRPLNFKQARLGNNQSWTDITNNMTYSYSTGNESYSFPLGSKNEYLIQAFDSFGYSNYVTVSVGYYNLISNTSGIFKGAIDTNVSGVVRDESGSGVQNLNISILDFTGSPISWDNNCHHPPNNFTLSGGNFLFPWPTSSPTCLPTGLYYIQAINYTNGLVSNMHLIAYSNKGSGGAGNTLWVENPLKPSIPPSDESISIYETYPADLFETKSDGTLDSITNLNNFFINGERWGVQHPSCSPDPNAPYSLFYSDCPNGNPNTSAPIRFIANVSGDYYIFQQSCGGDNDNCAYNAQDIKTNAVLIHVLPLVPATGETQDNCVNATEINTYMKKYMPAYVNYNMYLIGPTGNRFTECPDFPTGQVINGYPTAEAVTAYKLAHIKYRDINNIIEWRMVLWYK